MSVFFSIIDIGLFAVNVP